MYIVLCSENASYAKRLTQQLHEIANANDISSVFDVFTEIKSICFNAEDLSPQVDLLYIDMDYPDKGGLKIADRFLENGYNGDIVFVSSTDNYALTGYDFGILNYLVKGITPDDKVGNIFLASANRKRSRDRDTLLLSCAGNTICVPIEDIRYFEINSRIVTVHYQSDPGEKTFEFYSSMKHLENSLGNKGFKRIHKSFLVNMGYVSKITLKQIYLCNGDTLPAGKKYVDKFISETAGDE